MGLTPFTYSRFLVPHLCNYEGWALFLDTDMLVIGDVAELFACADDKHAVMVVKNDLKFEWASVMLFNCAHPDNRILTPEYIETNSGMHKCGWTENVGDLPPEWNHLIGYDTPKDAKLAHYTQGIPCHPEVAGMEYEKEWLWTLRSANSTVKWEALMGNSVHAKPVYDRLARHAVG